MESSNSSESSYDEYEELTSAERDHLFELLLLENNLTTNQPLGSLVPAVSDKEKHSWLTRDQVLEFLNDKQDGDAKLFFQLYSSPRRIVFDMDEKTWYIWNGQHWVKNNVLVKICVRIYIRTQYRNLLATLESEKIDMSLQKSLKTRADHLGNNNYIKGVISLAKDLFSVESSAWNRCPYMLPVNNGIVYLKLDSKVRFMPDHPDLMIKTHAPADWKGLDAPAPRWKQFLHEVYECKPDTDDMIAYIHRLFGYMIYGDPKEHTFPIFYGEKGRTGRSTIFSHVLPQVIGDMLQAVSSEVIVHAQQGKAGSAHPHLMVLKNARIAYLSEIDQNTKINISQIKRLAGGDLVTARQNYGAMETWAPTHVLCLLTNHKPDVGAGDDAALWERIHLIPHTKRFVKAPNMLDPNEHKDDPDLKEKLQAETAGILAWLVLGCLIWQKYGLDTPSVIKKANHQFRGAGNQMARFFNSFTKQPAFSKIQAQQLYEVYKQWCDAAQEETPVSMKVFGHQIKNVLGEPVKSNGKMFYSSNYCFEFDGGF
jgi:putative DNA primase/helicase